MAESHREEIAKLEALYASNPGGRVFVHLAEALRKAGEHARAESILAEGLARHADSASGYVVLGRVLADTGNAADAETAFRRVLDLDGGNLVALRWLGDLAREGGRPEEALSHYRELLTRSPSSADVSYLIREVERERDAAGAAPAAEFAAPAGPGEAAAGDEVGAAGAAGPSEPAEPVYGMVELDALPGDLASFAGVAAGAPTESDDEGVVLERPEIDDDVVELLESSAAPYELDELDASFSAEPTDLHLLEAAPEFDEGVAFGKHAAPGDEAVPDDRAADEDASAFIGLDASGGWDSGASDATAEQPPHGEDAAAVPEAEIADWNAAPIPDRTEAEPATDGTTPVTDEPQPFLGDAEAVMGEPEPVPDEPEPWFAADTFAEPIAAPEPIEYEVAEALDISDLRRYEDEYPADAPLDLSELAALADEAAGAGADADRVADGVPGGLDLDPLVADASPEGAEQAAPPLEGTGWSLDFPDDEPDTSAAMEAEEPAAQGWSPAETEAASWDQEGGGWTAPEDVWTAPEDVWTEPVPDEPVDVGDAAYPDFPVEAAAAAELLEDEPAAGMEPAHEAEPTGPAPEVERTEPASEAVPPEVRPGRLATETLAELYLAQGFPDRAAEVYRALLQERPDSAQLRARLEQAESAASAGGRAASDDEAGDVWLRGVEAAWTGGSGATSARETPYAWSEPGDEPRTNQEIGQDIGSYLRGLVSWRAVSSGGPSAEAESSTAAGEPVSEDAAARTDAELSAAEVEPEEVSAEEVAQPWAAVSDTDWQPQPEPTWQSESADADDREPWVGAEEPPADPWLAPEARGLAPWTPEPAPEPEPEPAPQSPAASTGNPVEDAFFEWFDARDAGASAAPAEAGTPGEAYDARSDDGDGEPAVPASAASDLSDDDEEQDEDLEMFRSWLQSLKK